MSKKSDTYMGMSMIIVPIIALFIEGTLPYLILGLTIWGLITYLLLAGICLDLIN